MKAGKVDNILPSRKNFNVKVHRLKLHMFLLNAFEEMDCPQCLIFLRYKNCMP